MCVAVALASRRFLAEVRVWCVLKSSASEWVSEWMEYVCAFLFLSCKLYCSTRCWRLSASKHIHYPPRAHPSFPRRFTPKNTTTTRIQRTAAIPPRWFDAKSPLGQSITALWIMGAPTKRVPHTAPPLLRPPNRQYLFAGTGWGLGTVLIYLKYAS